MTAQNRMLIIKCSSNAHKMLSLSSLTSLNTNTVQESEVYVSQARSIKCIWTIPQPLIDDELTITGAVYSE